MSTSNDQKLEQAYRFIQDERLEEAVAILRPVVAAEPDNADAWWLMANAVSDPEEAREALQRVLAINSSHAEARNLLDRLNELYPPLPEAAYSSFEFGESADFDNLFGDTDAQAAVPPPSIPPEMPAARREEPRIGRLSAETEGSTPALDLDDLFGEGEPPFAEDEELPSFEGEPDFLSGAAEERPRRRSSRRTLVALAVVLVLIGVLTVILIVSQQPPAGPPSDQIALEAQVTMVPNPTASDTVQVVLDSAQSAANAQTQLLGGPATAQLEERGLGATLVIRVCRPAGTDLSRAMALAMETVARYSVAVQDEIAAVGADLVNCDRQDVLMSAAAPMDRVVAFANGSLSADDFRASWQWSP